MRAWIEHNSNVKVLPEAADKLKALLLKNAQEKGPGGVAGDTTLAVDGIAYTGTVLVGGTPAGITFKVRSTAPVKEAPAKAAKAAPKKAAPKKGKK